MSKRGYSDISVPESKRKTPSFTRPSQAKKKRELPPFFVNATFRLFRGEEAIQHLDQDVMDFLNEKKREIQDEYGGYVEFDVKEGDMDNIDNGLRVDMNLHMKYFHDIPDMLNEFDKEQSHGIESFVEHHTIIWGNDDQPFLKNQYVLLYGPVPGSTKRKFFLQSVYSFGHVLPFVKSYFGKRGDKQMIVDIFVPESEFGIWLTMLTEKDIQGFVYFTDILKFRSTSDLGTKISTSISLSPRSPK